MSVRLPTWMLGLAACGLTSLSLGQEFGPPDRDQPGDEMIQEYLAREADAMDARFLEDVANAEEWNARRPEYVSEFLHMLGLDPLPEKTPLEATVTGTVEGDGFVVENLHYQSVPGLYVTANLYRPSNVEADERLPAVLYVCGHSGRGRDGNKSAYMSHGIWFARHGYVCLVLDTLQLGEIEGVHHGTYREGRWWWHSRGYTPAGVECWNGVRGLDYLVSRPDVDPERLSVTGISGGGAVTFWIAGADDRVALAVPVSGMADLSSYVSNRVINGHCDCMFLYNTFQWPWTRIAGLIAPRPMLFINSDQDRIFPMDANERVINRLERLYSYFGAGDRVDAVVSVGGHAYREDIRQAAFRFHNIYFKNDARFVTDTEVDVVSEAGNAQRLPIEPKDLRVFPTDDDLPGDALNGEIDRHFVPMAAPELPPEGQFEVWRENILSELRHQSFAHFPERIPSAKAIGEDDTGAIRLTTEKGIVIPLKPLARPESTDDSTRVLLVIAGPDADQPDADWLEAVQQEGDHVYLLHPRGVGPTRWTRNDPPNYVERSHVLLGRTTDSGRVWDIAAVARYLNEAHGEQLPIAVAGLNAVGVLGAYAALLEPDINTIILSDPPNSHMDPGAPVLLNVLRVVDVPEALGLLAPRTLTLLGQVDPMVRERVEVLRDRAGAADGRDAQ